MNKFLLFFLLIIALLSCKKSPNEMPVPPESPSNIGKALCQIKTNKETGHVIATRLYNDAGKLYLETTKDELTGIEFYQQFFYKEGKLYRSDISNENRKRSRIDYEYFEGKLSKMRFFEFDRFQNSQLNFERYFEYKKGILRKISTKGSDGSDGEFTVFTSVNGNVIGTKTYSANGQLLNAFQFEYDNKVNPYYGQSDYFQSYLGYSKSNVVKSTFYDFSGNGSSKISLFKYEYNIQNLPVASYIVENSGLKRLIVTFEYK